MVVMSRWWLPAMAYGLGSILVFLGERVAAGGAWRWTLDGVGLAGLAASLILRLLGGGRAKISSMPTWFTLAGIVGVGLYFGSLAPEPGSLPSVGLVILGVATWLAATTGLAFVEHALVPMRRAGQVEPLRLALAARTGLELALAVCFLLALNYLAAQHDLVVDASYFRTASPGDSTRKLVQTLDGPVEVLLFAGEADEVAQEIEQYIAPLTAGGSMLTYRRVDRLLEPDLARKYEVRSDGTLVLVEGDRSERLYVGSDMAQARSRLRKLDGLFHQRLVRLARSERVAYRVVGHGELGTGSPDGAPIPGIRRLQDLLRMQGFRIEELGLAQGLGSTVPDDADLVLVLGPTEELMPEEAESLRRYYEAGGPILVALDPESGKAHRGLTSWLGVRFSPYFLVAKDQFVRIRFNDSDRRNLVTDRFESHGVTTTLNRIGSRIAVAFFGAGALTRTDGGGPDLQTRPVVQSLADVWEDTNGNLQLDGSERTRSFPLVVATTRAPSKAGSPEARALVFADAHALTDLALGNRGNGILASDALRWLTRDESLIGEVESQADIPIQHTREGDAVWFYSTVFGVPLLVLGVGLLVYRSRRRW